MGVREEAKERILESKNTFTEEDKQKAQQPHHAFRYIHWSIDVSTNNIIS